ncbi:hypothetical protein [Streptomyces cyanogenus]|uniref:Uncharacterized protein n=1 Tax=Streptomyces cyanogenus TaxID=80860 RepID=A0ABX7TNB3_STRCY|nr:hypothetical protein S1361_12760 [Streptomyces cyanogenus]
MSADQEKHDMTHADIALLLADAADEVEIGIPPVQAVIRGGRRRKARRWAVAAATALVLAGSTGATLAFGGLPGERAGRTTPMAPGPASAEERHVYHPQQTELARGTEHGKEWQVWVQVWGAPRDRKEADGQFDAMKRMGLGPSVDKAADLVGKTSYFSMRSYGDGLSLVVMFDTHKRIDRLSGTDLQSAAVSLDEVSPTAPERLVVGHVAKTAREVTCRWKDGRSTVAPLEGPAPAAHDGTSLIRPVAGYPGGNWFVCLGPEGTSFKDAEVTK